MYAARVDIQVPIPSLRAIDFVGIVGRGCIECMPWYNFNFVPFKQNVCYYFRDGRFFLVLLVQLCAAYLYTVLYCGNKAQTTTMKQKTLPKKEKINTILFLRIGPYFVSTNQAAAFFASVAVIWRQAHILPWVFVYVFLSVEYAQARTLANS